MTTTFITKALDLYNAFDDEEIHKILLWAEAHPDQSPFKSVAAMRAIAARSKEHDLRR